MVLLLQFFNDQDWLEFRALEFQSLLQMHGIFDISIEIHQSMLYIVDTPISKEIIQKICQRSVLIKHIYELIASHPSSMQELVKEVLQSNYWHENRDTHHCSWNLQIHSLNRTFSNEMKESCRQMLTKHLPLQGSIDLKSPEVEYHLILEFPINANYSEISIDNIAVPVFFGKLLSRGGMREVSLCYSSSSYL